MSRSFHLGMDIAGALRNGDLGAFHTDQGRKLSRREAKKWLEYELAMGKKLIPLCDPCDCPNFDAKGGGCPGHESC